MFCKWKWHEVEVSLLRAVRAFVRSFARSPSRRSSLVGLEHEKNLVQNSIIKNLTNFLFYLFGRFKTYS